MPEDTIKRTALTISPAAPPVTEPAAKPAAEPVAARFADPAGALAALAEDMRALERETASAADPQALLGPSRDIAVCAAALRRLGMDPGFIGSFVTSANRRLFRRLFALTAPAGWEADGCLIVMGSEGRGEQILKTDQDNGVILRDGVENPDWTAALTTFSRQLCDLGYPPCPGGVMAENPEWAKSQSAFRRSLSSWLRAPDEAAALKLAIFADAAPVAGDSSLLSALRRDLLAGARDNQGFLHHFAKPALAFDAPRRSRLADLFGLRRPAAIDLKKSVMFPLVHGARALALEAGLDVAHTVERLDALATRRALDTGLARELIEAFFFVSALRLDAGLERARDNVALAPTAPSNAVLADGLTAVRRAGLECCVSAVNCFKTALARRFRLDA